MWHIHAVCNLHRRQAKENSQMSTPPHTHKNYLFYVFLLWNLRRINPWNITKNSINYCEQYSFFLWEALEAFEIKFSVPQPLSAPPPTPSFVWFILEAMRPRRAPERDLSPVWVSALLYLHLITLPHSVTQHSQLQSYYTTLLTGQDKRRLVTKRWAF